MSDLTRFSRLVAACAADTGNLDEAEVVARDLGVRRMILVEGVSDRAALETLGVRQGRDFGTEGIAIIPMGGAMSIGRFLRVVGPAGLGLAVTGLCDAGEEAFFRRALESAGLGDFATRADLENAGFFVCDADLEDELIRSLGPAAVEDVLEAEGDLATFRTFQRQPYQRVRSLDRQLHRFLGTTGGRKERYAGLLAEHLDLDALPRPIAGLLERA